MANNRTLQFHGLAYGNVPVELNAQINGEVVFSGTVPTIDSALPESSPEMTDAPVLFSIVGNPLFTTNKANSYPMTVEVVTGNGVYFRDINSNNTETLESYAILANSSINGTTLTVGQVLAGNIRVGQMVKITEDGVARKSALLHGDDFVITGGSGSTWTLSYDGGTHGPRQIFCAGGQLADETKFVNCFRSSGFGSTTNSENTPDSRSNVTIDGVAQVPPHPVSQGQYTWFVPVGSTIAYNLNVGYGNIFPS